LHKRLVANIISHVLLIACFFMVAPLLWAVSEDLYSREVLAFSVTIFLGLILACLFRWFFRVGAQEYSKVNTKDGLAVVGISWILLSAIGALPLFLSQQVPSYTDAFFEITSGFTTTGASILFDVEALPRGILFWRSLTHWLGGMGIIVLYLALLPALGQTAVQLYRAESTGLKTERMQPRIKETAKLLWSVYFFFSFVEFVLHFAGGMSAFDALCHTFGAVSTGGFSTRNASLGAFGAYHQWVVTVFMFLGGTNFILHYQFLRGDIKAFFKSEEFRFYFSFVLVLIGIFAVVLNSAHLTNSPIRTSAFQVVSILTATGFVTANFDAWPQVLRFLLLAMMFIGGCGGSTSGGMKIVRFLLAIKISARSVVQSIFPNAVLPIKIDGAPLSNRLITEALTFFVIYILVFFVGTFLFIMTENCDIVTAFSATISLLSNVGPGLGAVGPAHNFGWVSLPGKWLLSCIMLVGRLEFYSILILFLPAAWRK